ncbi:Uncharacterised protein [Mycobacteroides abscessus subsp. abscessus]|nr:Uncharacterised protein [Mycobacteroides abscessus subsp. abscessus]
MWKAEPLSPSTLPRPPNQYFIDALGSTAKLSAVAAAPVIAAVTAAL